jgi:hypothetical protein
MKGVNVTPEYFFKSSTIWIKDNLERKKVKGKAVPLQAWTGPEGSRRLRLPDFKTLGTRRW